MQQWNLDRKMDDGAVMKLKTTKNRARYSILSEMLAFPMLGANYFSTGLPIVGDLVSLSFAFSSKWYVSWVVEISDDRKRYLLESIEDGELCWWENVRFNIFDRNRVKERPSLKWNDRQFQLNDKWIKTSRKIDGYRVIPNPAVFNENNDSVEFSVRIRFGIDDYTNSKTFENWRTVTIKELRNFCENCVSDYNSIDGSPKTPQPSPLAQDNPPDMP